MSNANPMNTFLRSAGALSFVLGTVAACSFAPSTPTPQSKGDDLTEDDDSKTKAKSKSKDTSDTKDSKNDASKAAAKCGAKKSADDCFACCGAEGSVDALAKVQADTMVCLCKSNACGTQCADNACAGKAPTKECGDCTSGKAGKKCMTAADEACAKNEGCAAIDACISAAKCDSKGGAAAPEGDDE